MTKHCLATVLRDAVSMGDCAYEYFEHVEAVLDGMVAISKSTDLTDQIKLMQLERGIRAALCLALGGGCLVDAETDTLRELLKSGGEA